MVRVLRGLGLLFFTLALVRAILVPLTYDEAASYLRFIVSDPLSVFSFATATNHLLNTLLTRATYTVAGDSELVLRLPNLLGYVVYLWFAHLIVLRVRNPVIALIGFLLLNLNPYVLDFFALSRGYGLSLALLLGAVYFLLRSLPLLTSGAPPGPDVSRALILAGAATLANFTLANVFVAIVVLLFCGFVLFNRLTGSIRLNENQRLGPGRRRTSRYWPWLTAVVFAALVLSQDLGLSGAMYEPVIVRIPGLSQGNLDAVMVSRVDVRGRGKPLTRHDREWRLEPSAPVAGLRIEMPVEVARTVGALDVIIGNRAFSHRRTDDDWQGRDIGGTRVLESRPSVSVPKSGVPAFQRIINWRGDAVYSAYLARNTAIVLVLLAVLALVLKGLGWLLIRLPLVTAPQWRVLASAILWLAPLIGVPLYLLKRDGELYLGGTRGLIEDTYRSVIDGSFYNAAYHSTQIPIVVALILFTVAAALLVAYLSWRRGTMARALPALVILAILVLVSMSEIVQRFLLGTPYLLGRMALFFIPLYLLFAAFLADAAAALGRTARAVAGGALGLFLCVSVYHFVGTLNVTRTWEWPADVCTKRMMGDLGWVLENERPERSDAALAVDWMHYPVATYYGQRNVPVFVHVSVGNVEAAEFAYVQERNRSASANVIKRYPACSAVLLRASRHR